MALRSKKPQAEDAEARAMRRMQTFDQSDSDLDQSNSDASEQEDPSEEESEEESSEADQEAEESQEDDEEEEEEEAEDDDDSADSDDSDDDSENSDDSDGSDDSDEDDDDKKLRELQNNLSQIPFDKLAEIQQKLGMKVFHQTLRGSEKKKAPTKGLQRQKSRAAQGESDDDEEESDEDDSEEERKPTSKMDKLRNAMNKDKKERKIIQKRTDKNRPMEIGSKKPVGRFRQVVEVPTAKRRDPRFDSLSGKLDNDLFEKSYSFLKDYQADEMKKLKDMIKKEKDMETKEKLQYQLSRMVDRQATEAAQKRRQEIKREHKRKEKELVAKGKNPFYLKKSDQKKLELIDKFQHLKDNPKALSRVMEKRRKRNTAKEKANFLGGKRRKVA
ncbi:rRNA biogenesis protein rrp36 [Mortierella alpina]|nr:rRNA biogenesis protein rrp36 [Mortierella alpina]